MTQAFGEEKVAQKFKTESFSPDSVSKSCMNSKHWWAVAGIFHFHYELKQWLVQYQLANAICSTGGRRFLRLQRIAQISSMERWNN